jgi:hypothetical protein
MKLKKLGNNLSTTLELFASNLKLLNLTTHKSKELLDYMNQTIFTHFTLYKYVFSMERDKYIKKIEQNFYSPTKELVEKVRLKDSKSYSQWEQQQKKLEFERKENEIVEKHRIERQKLVEYEEMAKNLILYVQNDAYGSVEPLDENLIRKMIDDLANPVLDIVSKSIQNDINETKEKQMLYAENKRT